MNAEYSWLLPSCLALGALLGTLHFVLLRHMVDALVAGGPIAGALAASVLRLAVAGGVLWTVAQQGALPLLAVLAGFLIARFVILKSRKGT